MQIISALRLVYQTKAQSWAVEITLEDGTTQRVPMSGPDQVDTFVRSFDGSSGAMFDAATGEVVFLHEPISLEDLMGFEMPEQLELPSPKGPRKGKRR